MRNTGILFRPPLEKEYKFGSESAVKYEDRLSDWTPYLPTSEKQRMRNFDTMACVTFSAHNIVEDQINYLIRNKLSKEQIEVIERLGYLDGNYKCNFSDRFTAKMSGTTKEGNYLTTVAECIRTKGLIPEKDWPTSDKFNWDGYYAEIPEGLKEKAKKFLEIFKIQYEWVITSHNPEFNAKAIEYHIRHSPIQIATPICGGWSNKDGVVATCPVLDPAHATMIYNKTDVYHDFDHYVPFEKKLALDYPIPFALKIVVSVKEKEEMLPDFKYTFNVNLKLGDKASPEVRKLQEALQFLGYMKRDLFGAYGPQTQAGVEAFQVSNGIFGNKGVNFGPQTRAAMNDRINGSMIRS